MRLCRRSLFGSGGLVLLFMLLPSLHAEVNWPLVHETSVRGIDLLYNLEMEKALVTFDSVRTLAPEDPRGMFFRSMVHFWTFSLRNSEEDFQLFMAYSDSVITMCENLIDRNDQDPVPRFYLGGIHGYRGLAMQMQGDLLNAVMEGRSGYLSLEEAVHLDPAMADAHMGFGLFRYLVAKIPASISWVTKLLGFEGDLEGGLASLRYAADHGVYTRSEANLYLSQFLRREGKPEEARRRLDGLIQDHPGNSLFLVLLANWEYRDNNIDSAMVLLDRAEEINERTSIRHGEEFIHSTRGAIAFRKNDFGLARREFDRFLEQTTLQSRVPNITYYRIAVSRELTGDRSGAVEACRLMRTDDETFRRMNGAYFFRKGEELTRRPLGEGEKYLVLAGNAGDRDELDSSAYYYERALAVSGGRDDVRAVALHGLQEVAFDKGNYQEVIDLSQRFTGLTPVEERWALPYARLLAARAFKQLGRYAEAYRELDLAEDFDDYDFQESLEERVDREREEIDQLKDQQRG